MIPVAKAGGEFKGGIADFFRRRARRILPPYYACLAVTAILYALRYAISAHSSHKAPAFSIYFYLWYSLTHLLLVQNIFHEYSQSLNGALWTVATEWQIYFVFPFILAPIFKKWGPFAALFFGYAVGLATYPFDFRDACFWYVGLFALGMAGADMCFSPKPWLKFNLNSLLWISIVSAAFSTVCRYILTINPGDDPLTDLFTGVCAASFITYLVRSSPLDLGAGKNRLRGFLSSRPCVTLGAFSYSLYLIHVPIIVLALTCLGTTKISGDHKFLLMYLFVMPLCLVLAYGFHLLFEKPFMAPVPKPSDRSLPVSEQAKEIQPSGA